MLTLILAAILLWSGLAAEAAWAGQTLETVRANRVVRGGVGEDLPGFSQKNKAGSWQGFDIDFCRALAAAVLGHPDQVSFVPVTYANRFPVLLSGKIDVLLHTTTYTFKREAAIGVHFAGVMYYDGQAFLVPKKSGLRQPADLNGATICVGKRTTHGENLAEYFEARGWTYKPLAFESLPEMTAAFFGGRCQALTLDRSQLAAVRAMAPGGASEYDLLPETISKEPLGPVVRRGDDEWLSLVKWVLYALIEAEERGVTQANARTLLAITPDPALRTFLASDGLSEKSLGIAPGWVVRVIEAVGNYGEIFERHFGSQSGLNLERGPNRLWTQGGLMYAPPFR
ncbi:MAG: amino acid ABC transporter substrate-binding protein [Desulfobaccales bacterium]